MRVKQIGLILSLSKDAVAVSTHCEAMTWLYKPGAAAEDRRR